MMIASGIDGIQLIVPLIVPEALPIDKDPLLPAVIIVIHDVIHGHQSPSPFRHSELQGSTAAPQQIPASAGTADDPEPAAAEASPGPKKERVHHPIVKVFLHHLGHVVLLIWQDVLIVQGPLDLEVYFHGAALQGYDGALSRTRQIFW